MKKIIVILALLLTAGTQISFANEPAATKVSKDAKRAFEKQFPGAHYASWQQLNEMDVYLVRFGYNSKSMVAYIDGEGAILATVRNLQADNLPFSVTERLDKNYAGYEIRLIEELTIEAETSYLILIESEKAKVTVRVFGNGDSYEVKRIKKKASNSIAKK